MFFIYLIHIWFYLFLSVIFQLCIHTQFLKYLTNVIKKKFIILFSIDDIIGILTNKYKYHMKNSYYLLKIEVSSSNINQRYFSTSAFVLIIALCFADFYIQC